MQEQT